MSSGVPEPVENIVLIKAKSGFLGDLEFASIEGHYSAALTVCSSAGAMRVLQTLKPRMVLIELAEDSSFKTLARTVSSSYSGNCMAIVRAVDTHLALRAMREGAADVICFDPDKDLAEQLEEVTRRTERWKRRRRPSAATGKTVEGDLLLGTSHDLKGPLGIILTSAEMLASLAVDPKRKQYLTKCIASSARGAITLLDSIVSVQRLAEGKLTLERKIHNVSELLEEVCEIYAIVAETNRVEIRLEQIDSSLHINADRVALLRIVSNLVQNAIKYTAPGGAITVTARVRKSALDISVRDTGRGIPQDQLNQIFQRYSRLTEHKNIEGTGLGLYVSNVLAQAHDGSLKVRSKRGVGSVFTLQLPLGR